MDTRGQSGGWRGADTADPSDDGALSATGFVTRGIADSHTHYYTRLYVDAARAADAVWAHPVAAGRSVVVLGGGTRRTLAKLEFLERSFGRE